MLVCIVTPALLRRGSSRSAAPGKAMFKVRCLSIIDRLTYRLSEEQRVVAPIATFTLNRNWVFA